VELCQYEANIREGIVDLSLQLDLFLLVPLFWAKTHLRK